MTDLIQITHLTATQRRADLQNDAPMIEAAEVILLDFSFDIPYTKTMPNAQITSLQSLPSSIFVDASKSVTIHTAFSDTQAIHGICVVSSQVEARSLLWDSTMFHTFCPAGVSKGLRVASDDGQRVIFEEPIRLLAGPATHFFITSANETWRS